MRYTVEVNENGTYWYKEGTTIRHREDGPAIEHRNGNKYWYLNNQLHREDGPAIEYTNGEKYWYLNGERLTEEEFNAKTKPSCNGKIVEIDGKKFKLVEV